MLTLSSALLRAPCSCYKLMASSVLMTALPAIETTAMSVSSSVLQAQHIALDPASLAAQLNSLSWRNLGRERVFLHQSVLRLVSSLLLTTTAKNQRNASS